MDRRSGFLFGQRCPLFRYDAVLLSMTAHTTEMPVDLPCHVCGYNLRAHEEDAKCPECGTPVADSRKAAAIPLRPAWRNSDPRWRRRMITGIWILVFLPLMDVLMTFGVAERIPAPAILDHGDTIRTLNDTLISRPGVFPLLAFCTGVALVFSKERARRSSRMDWTRRWGVLCTYVVLLIRAAGIFFISALILAGIAALFHSMPLKYQPPVTELFVAISSNYLRYGPYPKSISEFVLTAFSSITILLACIPLFDALRSSGSRSIALILVFPLGLFALTQVAQVARYWLGFPGLTMADVYSYELYFRPQLLASGVEEILRVTDWFGFVFSGFSIEVIKWCSILTIAIWLTIAQIRAWACRRQLDRA